MVLTALDLEFLAWSVLAASPICTAFATYGSGLCLVVCFCSFRYSFRAWAGPVPWGRFRVFRIGFRVAFGKLCFVLCEMSYLVLVWGRCGAFLVLI